MNKERQRLLIVDDDQSYRDTLARSLTRRGFVTLTAATPDAALQCCREQAPDEMDYILLDLNLGGQSGLNLIRPLLALAPLARIVVLTGYASIQTAVGAVKLGAAHYLPKPASVAEIVRALREDLVEIPEPAGESRLSLDHLEWEYIQRTLAEHDGNIAATARALKMHRRTLQRKLGKRRGGDHAAGD